ncbi:MAG TPA: hypothetical protein VNL14_07925 [Candidatus Acidoferrales bacterium]|nr:hypothetical protein [Candidatus Acidoferrales bacterium]
MGVLDAAKMCGHLVVALPPFLARRPDERHIRACIQQKFAARAEHFLRLVKTSVFDYPRSPYRALFREAGCAWGDLEALVRRDGLEAALAALHRAGVYLKFDEFKGKREVKRGAKAFRFHEGDFDNPRLTSHFEVRSGGTRSSGTRTLIDLDFIAALALDTAILFDVHGLGRQPHAVWLPLGGMALIALLMYSRVGAKSLRWFSQVDGRTARLSFKYRLGTDLLILYGRAFGGKLPLPEYVPVYEAKKIAIWLLETLRTEKRATVTTFASSAVRVCLSAGQLGGDLGGAAFITVGEPLTAAKRKVIEASGAKAIPRYAFTEAGILGYGCGTPAEPDDMHHLRGNSALINAPRAIDGEGRSVAAFYVTSLLKTAPKILINVENGDFGAMVEKRCSCGFGELGYSVHLSAIRSFEKLTGEGVTFAGVDLTKILEEALPARFGGTGVDYQVVEEETAGGFTRLSLIVSPALGEIDERALIDCFLTELGRQAEVSKIMAEIWAQAGALAVRRALPLSTRAGKVFPFHLSETANRPNPRSRGG